MVPSRSKILFVSETVTLSHAARPAVLASALDPHAYEVVLAWDPRYASLFPNLSFPTIPIRVVDNDIFNAALKTGKPFLDEATLRSHVEEDLRLLRKIQPDVVVGDFRLSLTISAALERVPLWAIANPPWSPFADFSPLMPENPALKFFPTWVCDHVLFPIVFRKAQRAILAPFQKIRREVGLAPLAGGLRQLYTQGDLTLYDGSPDFTPLVGAPPTHLFLGPILWSPAHTLPNWWTDVPTDRPCVYLNMGTSGDSTLLDRILAVLSKKNVSVMLATAKKERPSGHFKHMFVADFLPGEEAARRADLMICNGGNVGYQSFSSGTPVLGLASNLDQILFMRSLEKTGRGLLLRSFEATPQRLANAIDRLLARPRAPTPSDPTSAPTRFAALVAERLVR